MEELLQSTVDATLHMVCASGKLGVANVGEQIRECVVHEGAYGSESPVGIPPGSFLARKTAWRAFLEEPLVVLSPRTILFDPPPFLPPRANSQKRPEEERKLLSRKSLGSPRQPSHRQLEDVDDASLDAR